MDKTLTNNRADLSAQLAANLTAVRSSLERTQRNLQAQINALSALTSKSGKRLTRRINRLGKPPKGQVSQTKQIAALKREVQSLTTSRQQLTGQIQSLQNQVRRQQQQINQLEQQVAPSTSPTPVG